MTSQKAVKIIDFTIQRKLEIREGFIDPTKSWNRGEPNISGISMVIQLWKKSMLQKRNSFLFGIQINTEMNLGKKWQKQKQKRSTWLLTF